MKYIIILGDGMADEPIEKLNGKTPLEVANKPHIDGLAKRGEMGMVQTIPKGFKPASDVANLSVLGYDVAKCYSGRSPLEAVSIGIKLEDSDVTYRANLVTIQDGVMLDYSAGEISTKEAKILIEYLQKNLKLPKNMQLFAGTSYRHCLKWQDGICGKVEFTPPHDITGREIKDYLPKGENSKLFLDIIKESYELLKDHPINAKRKHPANSLWFWGEGKKPQLESFEEKFGLKAAAISAVDLIKGIAILAKMKSIDVEGATGNIDTNFDGKADAAIDALLNQGYDFVFMHIEAPDECGHQGLLHEKIRAIELIDQKIVGKILNAMENEDFCMMILPDHRTPIAKMTHTSDPVPYLIYRSNMNIDSKIDSYCEKSAEESGNFMEGGKLIKKFICCLNY